MATTADRDIFRNILNAEDTVEGDRVMDGTKLVQEQHSSASLGKKATLTYTYSGPGCTGYELTIEDV